MKSLYLNIFLGLMLIFIAGVMSLKVVLRYGSDPFPKPRETNIELIQDWMTLGYISRIYGVPGEVFVNKLELNQEVLRGKSIKEIAKDSKVDTNDLNQRIRTIIVEFQASNQLPQEKH